MKDPIKLLTSCKIKYVHIIEVELQSIKIVIAAVCC